MHQTTLLTFLLTLFTIPIIGTITTETVLENQYGHCIHLLHDLHLHTHYEPTGTNKLRLKKLDSEQETYIKKKLRNCIFFYERPMPQNLTIQNSNVSSQKSIRDQEFIKSELLYQIDMNIRQTRTKQTDYLRHQLATTLNMVGQTIPSSNRHLKSLVVPFEICKKKLSTLCTRTKNNTKKKRLQKIQHEISRQKNALLKKYKLCIETPYHLKKQKWDKFIEFIDNAAFEDNKGLIHAVEIEALEFIQKNPDKNVVFLAGDFHCKALKDILKTTGHNVIYTSGFQTKKFRGNIKWLLHQSTSTMITNIEKYWKNIQLNSNIPGTCHCCPFKATPTE